MVANIALPDLVGVSITPYQSQRNSRRPRHGQEVKTSTTDIELMAHLMRRAGFGATRVELEVRAAKGYEETVEELLRTDSQDGVPDDLLYRYHPDQQGGLGMGVRYPDQSKQC